MRLLTQDDFARLFTPQDGPCVSLYQTTHRTFPDRQQDPIRYKNLLKQLEASLNGSHPSKPVQAALDRVRALAGDENFWNHRTEGLVVFATPEMFEVFDLHHEVPERVVVADSLHIKPLIRITQAADRFQVLCINRQEARLYQGNRDALDRIELQGAPSTIIEVPGEGRSGPTITVPGVEAESFGPTDGDTQRAFRIGPGSKPSEDDKNRDRFFRIIDRAVTDHHSRPSGLPLVLVTFPEYQTPFREISQNPHLVDEGIAIDPHTIDERELRHEVWKVMSPRYQARLTSLIDAYQQGKVRGSTADDLADAARAAISGRIGTLLIEEERVIPGRIDPATGDTQPGELSDRHTDDMLDDLAEMVLRTGGQVVVLPPDQMPTKTGLAATYRY